MKTEARRRSQAGSHQQAPRGSQASSSRDTAVQAAAERGFAASSGAASSGAASSSAPRSVAARAVRDLTRAEFAELQGLCLDLVCAERSRERGTAKLVPLIERRWGIEASEARWLAERASCLSPANILSWSAGTLKTGMQILRSHLHEEGPLLSMLRAELMWFYQQGVVLRGPQDPRTASMKELITLMWKKELLILAVGPTEVFWRDRQLWEVCIAAARDPLTRASVRYAQSLMMESEGDAQAEQEFLEALATFSCDCVAGPVPSGPERVQTWMERIMRFTDQARARAPNPADFLMAELDAGTLQFWWAEWSEGPDTRSNLEALVRGVERLVWLAAQRPSSRLASILLCWFQTLVIGDRWRQAARGSTREQKTMWLALMAPMVPLLQVMPPTHEVMGRDLAFMILLAIANGDMKAEACSTSALQVLKTLHPEWTLSGIPFMPVILFMPSQVEWLEAAYGPDREGGREAFIQELLRLIERDVPGLGHWVEPRQEEPSRLPILEFLKSRLIANPNAALPQLDDFCQFSLRGLWLETEWRRPVPPSLAVSDGMAKMLLAQLGERLEVQQGLAEGSSLLRDLLFSLFLLGSAPPDQWRTSEQELAFLPVMWDRSLLRWVEMAPVELVRAILTQLDKKPGLCQRLARHLLGVSRVEVTDLRLPTVDSLERAVRAAGGPARIVLQWILCDAEGDVRSLDPGLEASLKLYQQLSCEKRPNVQLELAPFLGRLGERMGEKLGETATWQGCVQALLLALRSGLAKLSLDRPVWEKLPEPLREALRANSALLQGVQAELWLDWALGNNPIWREEALRLTSSVIGAIPALLLAWRGDIPPEEPPSIAGPAQENQEMILQWLDQLSLSQDLLAVKELTADWIQAHRQVLQQAGAGGRSRWVNWTLADGEGADAEGRLRRKITSSATRFQPQLTLSQHDGGWLLEQLSRYQQAELPPQALQLLVQLAQQYPAMLQPWWQTLQPEALGVALALARLQGHVPPEGQIRLVQILWERPLSAALKKRLFGLLMDLPEEQLLASVDQAALGFWSGEAATSEAGRQLLQRISRAWINQAQPSAFPGVLRLLDQLGSLNPLVQGRLGADVLQILAPLMEQPAQEGLSRWVCWWLVDAERTAHEVIDLPHRTSEQGLPWRLSDTDLSWLLGRLSVHPGRLLAEPLARAMLQTRSAREGELVAWLQELRRRTSPQAALPVALSLWRAGLPLEQSQRLELLRALRLEAGMSSTLRREAGAFLLSWEAPDLLPALKQVLAAGEFSQASLEAAQWRALRKKLQQWGQPLEIAPSRSPASSPASLSPASGSAASSSAGESPSAAAAASPPPAPPPLLFHPRFMQQSAHLPRTARAAVRVWLQAFQESGRASQERPDAIINRWLHAHITSVHPPLVVGYRRNRDSIKIDWIIEHDNAYLGSRRQQDFKAWSKEDKAGSPSYSPLPPEEE